MRGPLLRGALQTGYRQTKPHIGWMLFENDAQTIDVQTVVVQTGAWSLLGANGQPGSMAIGNTLMLLMKPPTAQGGSALSFPHPGHYLWNPERMFPACTGSEACTVVGFDR
jgi:hypothetical protein